MNRHLLKIPKIIYSKWQAREEDAAVLEILYRQGGASLAVFPDKMEEFKYLLRPYGFEPEYTFAEALQAANLVIDCTDKGIARKYKEQYYRHLKDKLGFIAQGSENGFGLPYAFGINDVILQKWITQEPGIPFIQVVSCNTNQILRLLYTLALNPDQKKGALDFENLVQAEIDLDRRGADISQEKLPLGPRLDTLTHPRYGTHQGEDAVRVLATIDPEAAAKLDIHTRTKIFNQPYMHVASFRVVLKEKVSLNEVISRFSYDPLVCLTKQPHVASVFSRVRDFGFFGRMWNQMVVYLPNLEVSADGHTIRGDCLTPQDGNALISSIAAALALAYPHTYQDILQQHFLKFPYLFKDI